jgi:hypothetical protein
MLSVHSANGVAQEPMSAEEMQQSWQQIGALESEMKSAGAWVFSGRLHEPGTATVVRVAKGEIESHPHHRGNDRGVAVRRFRGRA